MSPVDMQHEVQYLKEKLIDHLFNQCGVEIDELEFNANKLEIEKDPEYNQMCEEYE